MIRYKTACQSYFYVVRMDSLLNTTPIGIISNNETIPSNFILYQNYPNPFNPQTTIKYDIPKAPFTSETHVTLVIYDILGKEVKTLVNEYKKTGSYLVEFDGSNLASGLYYYKISPSNYVETKKLVLIKQVESLKSRVESQKSEVSNEKIEG